jgi:hypothetical protein
MLRTPTEGGRCDIRHHTEYDKLVRKRPTVRGPFLMMSPAAASIVLQI